MTIPFWRSIPISINELPSRKALIQIIVQGIKFGVHSAVVGDLRSAKTSMLKYLADSRNRVSMFGDDGKRVIFNYVDCQMLPSDIDYMVFLEIALRPLLAGLLSEETIIRKNHFFEPYYFSDLLEDVLSDDTIFVLILDEFDVLLEHPSLKAHPFLFGWLRGIAGAHHGFVLIISSHLSLSEMTVEMWNFGSHGSPPLNIFSEHWLGPLPKSDVDIALEYARPKFERPSDYTFIYDVSGGHPFLVEIVASALWQQAARSPERYLQASEITYRNSEPYFLDKWHNWNDEQRKALTAVALIQAPALLQGHNFITKEVVIDLAHYIPELRWLSYRGEVVEALEIPGGYKLRQGAMLWWLADEILRSIRNKEDFEAWLMKKDKDNIPSSAKLKEALAKATGVFGQLLEKGATTLIEAYVKSLVNP